MMLAALILAQPAALDTGRYETGLRVKAVEAAWMRQGNRQIRAQAVPKLNQAAQSFFGGNVEVRNRALDEAWAILAQKPLLPEYAVAVRTSKPVYAPGETISLELSWAYSTQATDPIPLRMERETFSLEPGTRATWPLALKARREGDAELELRLGERTVRVPYSVVAEFEDRVKRHPDRSLADFLALASTGNQETTVPFAAILRGRGEEVFFASHDTVPMRAFLPARFNERTPVVVALHGAGVTPNMWFESYGAGLAVREARRRGWAFVAPQTRGVVSIRAALEFVAERTGKVPQRYVIMGHSMGGGVAMAGLSAQPAPVAAALFAPAATGLPKNEIPIYLAFGREDIFTGRSAQTIRAQESARPGLTVKEFAPCEHLMIVAEALPEAYRLFDRVLR